MAYGDYILETGASLEPWENAFSRHMYETHFQRVAPTVEIGPGRCSFLRQDPSAIIGVEADRKLVDHYANLGFDVRMGTIEDIPLEAESAGGAYACWLLEHVADPLAAMQEVLRVLKPGGRAVVVVPSDYTLTRGFYDDFTHVRPFTERSLQALAAAAGFSAWQVRNLYWCRGFPRLARRLGETTTLRIVRFSDRSLRRIHLVNRCSLELVAVR